MSPYFKVVAVVFRPGVTFLIKARVHWGSGTTSLGVITGVEGMKSMLPAVDLTLRHGLGHRLGMASKGNVVIHCQKISKDKAQFQNHIFTDGSLQQGRAIFSFFLSPQFIFETRLELINQLSIPAL